MRQSYVFVLCILLGVGLLVSLAEGNMLLAIIWGAALGCSVAIMILAFPLDLSYREPPRGKREVHVVVSNADGNRKRR